MIENTNYLLKPYKFFGHFVIVKLLYVYLISFGDIKVPLLRKKFLSILNPSNFEDL